MAPNFDRLLCYCAIMKLLVHCALRLGIQCQVIKQSCNVCIGKDATEGLTVLAVFNM